MTISMFLPKPKPSGTSKPPPRATRKAPRPAPKDEPESQGPVMDEPGTFTDYKIITHDPIGRKYNVVKFDSKKPITIQQWNRPVRMNRKNPKPIHDSADFDDRSVTPMLGLDGKPVIGPDGKPVLVYPDGKVVQPKDKQKPLPSKAGGPGGKKMPFKKKTKQVIPIPEEQRKMRKEERFPWVLEDGSGKETWTGKMDEVMDKNSHWAFFMPMVPTPTHNYDHFLFVPAHRWYKMQKRPHYRTLGLEEAEEEIARMQKSKNPQHWLMRRKGKQISDASAATFKAEAEGRTGGLGESSQISASGFTQGPGGRRLKAVDYGQRGRFEEDDEFGDSEGRRRKKEQGGEGEIDELEFEEDFADDDEQGDPDPMDDEEAKELEERLKKEYRQANKTNEAYVDGPDDDDDDQHLTGAGKDMSKLIKKIDRGAAYISDGEENPYAMVQVESDEDEPEEQKPPETPQPPQSQSQSTNGSSSQTQPSRPVKPLPASQSLPNVQRGSQPNPPSRANSPGLGNSLVAKRATSPKAPKAKIPGTNGSRATSPLASGGSRAASPVAPGSKPASRATSPVAPSKRKAEDHDEVASNAASPQSAGVKVKKQKTSTDSPAPVGPLTEEMVIEWLRQTPDATTKTCIHRFRKYVKDEAQKLHFTSMIKKLAHLKGGVLVLRSNNSGPSTPAA
ncbi:Rap30/74 interaction domain-containing protein [Sistotremastrum niveocremeum HHB9708]|uniref:Transcription initiation factor IIF subunit alpha n=1 Tax=Sistotremastrum niveocremeum HHB9708 TaxID=1314777 RepID=A0A164S7Y8_9AGAM|nr:Rap30/74 interaction domain-containing protein [Sistotremastrum niveocremeum HHB9708]